MLEKDLKAAHEIIPNKLYYVTLSVAPTKNVGEKHFFSIDHELVYWNFFLDFGPLNLGQTLRYCNIVNKKLTDPKRENQVIYHYSSTHPHHRTNASYLICAWSILYNHKTPDEAFAPFRHMHPPPTPWHDATQGLCTFHLNVLDTLRGLYKAREFNFFNLEKFDIAEYEHFEQVEGGDLNWLMDGKFIAFAGPVASADVGSYNHKPEFYVPYFKKKNVTLVIRFNKKYYDARSFTREGIDHMEMYFTDGSNPPYDLLMNFLKACEETPGAVAVHCKAGLGRTGTCIGCYFMKHYGWTAEETIGWLRVVRPGSIIGQQQQYMKDMQFRMWKEGEAYRLKKSLDIAEEAISAEAKMADLSKNMNAVKLSEDTRSDMRMTQGDYLRQRRYNTSSTSTSTPLSTTRMVGSRLSPSSPNGSASLSHYSNGRK